MMYIKVGSRSNPLLSLHPLNPSRPKIRPPRQTQLHRTPPHTRFDARDVRAGPGRRNENEGVVYGVFIEGAKGCERNF
jgi:hypothetical protein